MSEQPPDTQPVEETLAWEAEQGPRAGIAAAVAALATLVGGIVSSSVLSDPPHVPLVTAMRNAATPGADSRPSLRTPLIEFFHDKAGGLLLGNILLGLGFFALIPALGYLYRATKARRPELPRAALFLALIGPALLGVFAITFQIAQNHLTAEYVASADHSHAAANHVFKAGVLYAATLAKLPATLCLAFALVLLSINAMRTGLLTRFMGVLGIICGGALVLLPQNPIIVFWLLALGVLFAHRWPQGMPPAWETGVAVPWPTSAEIAEQRAAARGDAPTRREDPDPMSESEPPAPHPSSNKRKRKRRR
jgi:hypothetical protein